MTRLFLKTLCFVLFGYALFGRGFAYLGLPPVYVGEVCLMLGFLVLVADARVRGALPTWSNAAWFAIYMLCGWGVLRTVPYLSMYGADALRDGALWGYASFAFLLFALIMAYPHNLWRMVHGYRRFARAYPFLIFVAVAMVVVGISFPILSVTGTPVIVVKPGDVGVHLGGVFLFWLVGLAGPRNFLWISFLLATFLVVSVMSRGAILAFATPGLIYVLARRQLPRQIRPIVLAGAAVFLVFVALNPRVEVRPGRWLTPQQVALNVFSIFSTVDDQPEELEGTRAWRLAWWLTIADYTFRGDQFWSGKGFGINLAEEDGFPSGAAVVRPNRHPHSAHMSMLARAGVPGLVLWILVLVLWAGSVLRCYAQSSRAGHRQWAALFLFVFGYWASFLVNASFDVFLEGPTGGIWFWTLMGIGLAATGLYRRGCVWEQGGPSVVRSGRRDTSFHRRPYLTAGHNEDR